MIFFDEEKTDRKVDLETEGAIGDGWDFRSRKKKDILTTRQGWVKLTRVYKGSGETLQINRGGEYCRMGVGRWASK